jgi:hypothetical protein
MTWHSGQDLSQTVFTCLYVLHLGNLDPAHFRSIGNYRPELMTSVLRSYVVAVLKTCDIAVEEFRRGHLVEVRLSIWLYSGR